MKRNLLIGATLVATLSLAYVWYAHASIYWKLGSTGMGPPSDVKEYVIGDVKSPPLTYVAIGDSLTAGVGVTTYTESYPYLIAKKIADTHKRVTLTPFAVPGVRTSYVLSDFIDPVILSNPDVVTLLIGVNDIHGNVSTETFREHYADILARLTQGTHAKIYAINLPYIGTHKLIDPLFRHYFNWKTREFNIIINELATQYHVTYIDLYTAHKPHALDDTYYAADSFHPNAVGYTLWAQFIYAGFHQ